MYWLVNKGQTSVKSNNVLKKITVGNKNTLFVQQEKLNKLKNFYIHTCYIFLINLVSSLWDISVQLSHKYGVIFVC
jgi:hypothetical protein